MQRHVVVLDDKTTAGIFLDQVFVDSRRHHPLEHAEIGFRPISLAVLFEILHKRIHHLRGELCHFQPLFEDCVFGSGGEEVQKLLQTAQLRFTDMLRESR